MWPFTTDSPVDQINVVLWDPAFLMKKNIALNTAKKEQILR